MLQSICFYFHLLSSVGGNEIVSQKSNIDPTSSSSNSWYSENGSGKGSDENHRSGKKWQQLKDKMLGRTYEHQCTRMDGRWRYTKIKSATIDRLLWEPYHSCGKERKLMLSIVRKGSCIQFGFYLVELSTLKRFLKKNKNSIVNPNFERCFFRFAFHFISFHSIIKFSSGKAAFAYSFSHHTQFTHHTMSFDYIIANCTWCNAISLAPVICQHLPVVSFCDCRLISIFRFVSFIFGMFCKTPKIKWNWNEIGDKPLNCTKSKNNDRN